MRFDILPWSVSALVLLLSQFSQAYILPPHGATASSGNILVSRQEPTIAAANSTLITCLKPLGSKVLQRQTPSFEKNRYDFDLRYTFNPEVIVMAASAADIQTAVKCAKASNVPVAPRSGGHSFEGYSIGGQDGSLVIDLSGLSSVVVTGSKAKIGSGIRLGPLYLALFNQGGWTLNAGTCPSVGIGGHALGGGFGLLARKYGLLIDRIVEIELVNANGELLTVSATQNPDLFFALRGAGGGSYGVVTSFTVLPIKPAAKATSFTYDWKHSDAAAVLKAYVNFQSTASRDIGVELNVAPDGLMMYGIFQGTKSKQAAALAPFLKAAPKPSSSDVREGRHIDGQLRFAYIAGDPKDINALSLTGSYKPGDSRYTKGKSLVYPAVLKDSTIALLTKWGAKKPAGSTANYIIIDLWGGAVQDTSASATSFIHRDAHTVFEFVIEWDENPDAKPGKPDCQPCIKWMDDMYAEFLTDFKANYGTVRGYQNYIDKAIPDWEDAYYGSAITRLKQVKTAVDPGNIFRFPQSIPLQ
ncbi:hypothetical protein BGX29_000464 [Mortierella sp. GBA35]|nr:hypothetical protein BGX23_006561 [Mortierella sp. AD031]KAF9105190.1 hypothetical protein BGX29_000464 [Mortierella sp. GBA35]KAG0219009.1 hypothetical protein BGX33_005050 [Mortierella sp. NVP41]